MRRLFSLLTSIALVAVGFVAQPWPSQPAEAAPPGSAFDPGLIISDSVFFDFGTLTQAQIQAVLDSKVSDCRATDPAVDCLKTYLSDIPETAATGEGEVGPCKAIAAKTGATAAEIIYTIANACGVNPKVLIVTLQKEQGLVTSTKPTEYMYRAAMGFGCPDSDPGICGKVYTGLFNQLYRAAKQFRWYGNPAGSFTYWKPGRTVAMRYNPKSSCGTKSFELKSQATANLYYYTPYTPNDAALNNLYGTGDSCSAYGNRNFWRFYHDWFGSPIGGGYLLKAAGTETFLIVDKVKYRVSDTRLLASLRPLGPIGEVSQSYLDSFQTSGDAYQLAKSNSAGKYFLLVDGVKYSLADCSLAQHFGLNCDSALTLTDSQLLTFIDGGPLTRLVVSPEGGKYWIENGSKRAVIDDLALASVGGQSVSPTKLVIEQISSLAPGSALASELVMFEIVGSTDVAIAAGGKTYRFNGQLQSEIHLEKWFTDSAVAVEQEALAASLTTDRIHGYVKSEQGEYFILTPSGKLPIKDPENWVSSFVLLPASVLAKIPSVEGNLATPAVIGFSGTKTTYFVEGAQRRTSSSATMTTRLLDLLDQPQIVIVPKAAVSTINHAGSAFAPGSLVRANGTSTIYLIDDLDRKVKLASSAQASSISKLKVLSFDKSLINKLKTRIGFTSVKVQCDSETYLVDNGTLYPISPDAAKEYPGDPYPLATSTCAAIPVSSKPLGQFIRDSKKAIYFVENGKRSKLSSWSHYLAIKGDGPSYLYVSDYFLSKIPLAGKTPAEVQLASAENTPSGVFEKLTFNGTIPEVIPSESTQTPKPTPSTTTTPTPTQTASPAPTPIQTAEQSYKVVAGDTLNSIASRFGVAASVLQSYNNIANPNLLRVGQVIKIPSQGVTSTPLPTISASPSPSSSPSASPTQADKTTEVEYRVQSGDTLWSIASKFGVSVSRLQEYNGITNAAYIRIGQLLKIPTSTSAAAVDVTASPTPEPEAALKTYTVQSGDTLWGIARKLGIKATDLASLNGITDANFIRVGQVLKVPN